MQVDYVDVAGKSSTDVACQVLGPAGTPVTLTLNSNVSIGGRFHSSLSATPWAQNGFIQRQITMLRTPIYRNSNARTAFALSWMIQPTPAPYLESTIGQPALTTSAAGVYLAVDSSRRDAAQLLHSACKRALESAHADAHIGDGVVELVAGAHGVVAEVPGEAHAMPAANECILSHRDISSPTQEAPACLLPGILSALMSASPPPTAGAPCTPCSPGTPLMHTTQPSSSSPDLRFVTATPLPSDTPPDTCPGGESAEAAGGAGRDTSGDMREDAYAAAGGCPGACKRRVEGGNKGGKEKAGTSPVKCDTVPASSLEELGEKEGAYDVTAAEDALARFLQSQVSVCALFVCMCVCVCVCVCVHVCVRMQAWAREFLGICRSLTILLSLCPCLPA